MATSELAATYAALILADDWQPIWATLLAKALEGKNVKDLLSNVGAGGGAPAVGVAPVGGGGGAPAAAADEPKEEEKKEEKEESDDDMGFGLFD
ncbi:60S acidic ribosomal protein P1 [Boletus edulis]|nr:60S acidic ribosomal protein P1 [Boletus edulis]